MVAIGREPLPPIDPQLAIPRPEMPPPPTRLAPVAGIGTNEMPRISHDRLARTHRLVVTVRGAPANLLDDPGAGVSLFDSRTSGSFRWFPLRDLEVSPGGDLQLVATTVASTATVTLARREQQARHGYITSRQVDLDAGGDAPSTVELDATLHRVRLRLPPGVERAGPLQLKRVGDPQWLPIASAHAGLIVQRDVSDVLELGAGDYELQLPLDPDERQRFSIPGVEQVAIRPGLAPAPDGHR